MISQERIKCNGQLCSTHDWNGHKPQSAKKTTMIRPLEPSKSEHNESVKPISLNQLSSHIWHKTSPIPRWSKISTTTRSPTYQNKDLMDKQNVLDSPECWCQKIILEKPHNEHQSDEFSCSSTYSRLKKKKTGHVNHLQWAEHNQLGKTHSEFYKHSCQCEAFHTGQEQNRFFEMSTCHWN